MFLNCHSWFSFKYGVLKPEALLEEAARGLEDVRDGRVESAREMIARYRAKRRK